MSFSKLWLGIWAMDTFDVLNKKLLIVATAAVLILGTTVFFEDAYAGFLAGVFWTGEGDGSSWGDPDNWQDFFTEEPRLPECDDNIEIGEGATVHLNIDFTVCPVGVLDIFFDAILIIDPGKTLTNESKRNVRSSTSFLSCVITAAEIVSDTDVLLLSSDKSYFIS